VEAYGEHITPVAGTTTMRGAIQKAMSLLSPEHGATLSRVRDLLPQQRWSYSRRSVLEQCPRRYYYEYYAATVARGRRDPRIERLRRLKSLQNRYERTGTITHLVIATYFRKAQAGDVWKPYRVVDWARAIFRADVDYSTADPEGLSPREGRFPPVLLHEYFYRQRDALELCTAAEERLVAAVRVFFESINLAEFRLAGSQLGALVERNLTVSGLPCKTGGKLDLAFATSGYVTVVDWKLGEPNEL
jgi:PD-(D/E)XK nuclease superfamily